MIGNEKGSSLQQEFYRASEFARLAGVTVRALHHYDRLGLLRPKKRTAAGYRLYRAEDLERVEQIVALKFLGMPLKQIRTVLEREPLTLAEALGRQRIALLEKRRMLDRALTAIGEAERAAEPAPELLRRIIEVIEMQNDPNWMMKYYSPEARAKLEERKKTFTPEMQEQISRAWKDYYRDLAALNNADDPGGEKAAELAKRHQDLVAAFTGNDPEVEAGLKAFYKDRVNWPAEMAERMKNF